MKKRVAGALALMMAAALLGGCAKTDGSGIKAEDYVTLCEYKGVPIQVPTAEQLLEIIMLQDYFGRVQDPIQITERPVQMYDMSNIDYEGKKDGVAFAGGTAQGADLLIGSGQFIAGFEDGLIGVMPGETVDLPLRFPDNYGNADLAGQEVVFTVTVNYVSEMEDDKVKYLELDGVTNVEQYRQWASESFRSQAEGEYRARAENVLLTKVMSESVFAEFPEDMLAEKKKMYETAIEEAAQGYGMDGKTLLSMQGLEYESTIEQYALEHIRQQLLIQAIADRENLSISDKELDSRMNEYAESVGVTVKQLEENGVTKEDFRESFLYEDVMQFLVDHAVNAIAE